jgi:short-subunit dehydrogenase
LTGFIFTLPQAKEGMKILLISRSEEKLKNQAEGIKKDYKVDCKYCVFDFSKVNYWGGGGGGATGIWGQKR